MNDTRARKLLLVEDEGTLRKLIAQFLRAEGFVVVEAADGALALEAYETQRPFDLVLLDLNLPILCGVEVCRRIKLQNPEQPVLICSAAILDTDLEVFDSLQVRRYLTKPYLPSDLLAEIDSLTRAPSGASAVRIDRPHATPAGGHHIPTRSARPLNSSRGSSSLRRE